MMGPGWVMCPPTPPTATAGAAPTRCLYYGPPVPYLPKCLNVQQLPGAPFHGMVYYKLQEP
eukprot:9002974-Pyramimonas_sp.AAC.1